MSGTYGAVDQITEGESGFDVEETYYVRDKPLTDAERSRKLLACGVPLTIGILVFLAIILFLLHDFGNLYPAPGAYPPPTTAAIITAPSTSFPVMPTLPTPPPVPAPTPAPQIVYPLPSNTASCVNYAKCSVLNLTGFCCPTPSNVTLSCCL